MTELERCRRDVERIQREREELHQAGATAEELERNRLQLVAAHGRENDALIDAYLLQR